MTCYSPNFIFKKHLKPSEVLKYKLNEDKYKLKVSKDSSIAYRFITGKEVKDKDYFLHLSPNESEELVPVPCGCCIGCRLDYSLQWASRCMLESTMYKDNWFITLTLSDDNLKYGKYGNATLVPDDLSKFVKSLRQYYKRNFNLDNIRFFGCGEYGDMSMRPHYHLIVFNCPIPDLTTEFPYVDDKGNLVYTHHRNGADIYYYSKIIADLWKKGNVVIGECSFKSCAYVARYVVKKVKGKDSDVYNKLDIVPEFVRMSRRPGIGYEFLSDNYLEIATTNSLYFQDNDSCRVITPPRYFQNLLKIKDELLYEITKFDRVENSNDRLISIYNSTELHYSDYLSLLEERKDLQIQALKRNI